MVTPATVSRNLLVVATISLVFCCDAFLWHTIPLGFEGTLAYGGSAFCFGVILASIALVLAIIGVAREGRALFPIVVCVVAVVTLLAYAAFAELATP